MTIGKIALVFLLSTVPFFLDAQHTVPGRPDYKSVQYQFPYLKWGTFFVSNVYLDFTNTNAVAADRTGNAYYAGDTEYFIQIPTPGCFQYTHGGGEDDGFIQKFDANGERIWGTYYGGNQPDYIYDVVVDREGYLVVAGLTGSPSGIATDGTYQTSINGQGDGFIAKFNPDGTREWGTYLGGIGNDWIAGVGVDNDNNILVCGNTRSSNYFATAGSHQPNYGGGQFGDGFLAKFSPDGQIVFCTYYGGATYDETYNVCCDQQNNIYMVGETNSDTAIATAGTEQPAFYGPYTDGFVVKFSPEGERVWGTYLGGPSGDYVADVCVDMMENVYVVGGGASWENIATTGSHKNEIGYVDGYLVKYNTSGNRVWGTYFGGEEEEGLQSIRYNESNQQLIIGGSTNSDGEITLGGAHQPNWYYSYTQQGDPRYDGMIAAFDTAGLQQWGTYMGGNMHDNIYDLDLDTLGNIVYCGEAGSQSSVYLTTPGCFQSSHTNVHASFFGMFALDTLVGVRQLEDEFNPWFVYPNPFQEYIHLCGPFIKESAIFEIWDLQGFMLEQGNVNKEENLMCLGNLSNGIYILKVIKGNQISTIKIVKK